MCSPCFRRYTSVDTLFPVFVADFVPRLYLLRVLVLVPHPLCLYGCLYLLQSFAASFRSWFPCISASITLCFCRSSVLRFSCLSCLVLPHSLSLHDPPLPSRFLRTFLLPCAIYISRHYSLLLSLLPLFCFSLLARIVSPHLPCLRDPPLPSYLPRTFLPSFLLFSSGVSNGVLALPSLLLKILSITSTSNLFLETSLQNIYLHACPFCVSH